MKARLFKIALSLFIVVQISGCATYKRCSEKFQWKSDTITTISYRDTIIPVHIGETLPALNSVFINGKINLKITAQSGTAYGEASIIHDTLKLKVQQMDSTYMVKLDSAIKVIDNLNKQLVVKTEKAKLSTILWQVFGIIALILLIVLVTRLFKKR